jgi:prepilin-type N-terminal cleavage/methylation domain-containing protein
MKKGFTLIEVIFTAGILAFAICGLLLTYINLFSLGDISRKMTLANNALQAKLEEIKNGSIDYNPFDIPGFAAGDAKGVVYVSNVSGYSDLKRVRIIVCFRQKGQRIVGEDKNLNGIWDTGEDTVIVNNQLDSPVEVVTLIAR